ncbi:MAG TPA: hypothetical protein PKN39_05590 [Oscillospiraceae bacterium]|nr:hypothetical protein [Oscillospiraceae bacterium]
MDDGAKRILSKVGKFKYPLIVLAVGLALLLWPGGGTKTAAASDSGASDAEARLEYVLSRAEGVGTVQALLSDDGAVVVCAGADDARVRLEITDAVCAYTGLTSDRVTVLKIEENNGEANP